MIPPKRFATGRSVGNDEHRCRDLEVAQHWHCVTEDPDIRIIERDGRDLM
jgi:hypothetical protein